MTGVANIKRLTTAGREYVLEDETIDPNAASELVRILDLIDRTLGEDDSHKQATPTPQPNAAKE